MTMMGVTTANRNRIIGNNRDSISGQLFTKQLLTLTHLFMRDLWWALAQCRGDPLVHHVPENDALHEIFGSLAFPFGNRPRESRISSIYEDGRCNNYCKCSNDCDNWEIRTSISFISCSISWIRGSPLYSKGHGD